MLAKVKYYVVVRIHLNLLSYPLGRKKAFFLTTTSSPPFFFELARKKKGFQRWSKNRIMGETDGGRGKGHLEEWSQEDLEREREREHPSAGGISHPGNRRGHIYISPPNLCRKETPPFDPRV